MVRVALNDADHAAALEWRSARRRELLASRVNLSLDEYRQKSEAVLARLVERFPAILPGKVGIYWPYRREISLFPLATRIFAEGGSVSLPAVVQKARPVQFRAWRPGDPLAAGAYDIPFPRDGPAVEPETLIVALVGFDQACFRLGYGGGYYDRTLAAATPRPRTIGVGFEFMRMDSINPLAHDIPMDFIVTEEGVCERPSA